jgi:signal transduction histidine kinase
VLRMESVQRMPAAVEAAAYFAVSESLTNINKHSGATTASVSVVGGERLVVEIRDDGRGGAREAPGGGLAGMRKRVGAFDGEMSLVSPEGGPTVLRLELPGTA